MANEHYFEVTLARSSSGRSSTQKLTLLGLGLTKTGRTVHLKDTPAIRGMIYKVVHLVSLVRRHGTMPLSKRALARSQGA